MKIGEIMAADREITLNEGKKTVTVTVANKGDRPVQVGSHFHFFEVNKCLSFDREKAYGYHLDIPSGTSVRFEPGEEKEVQLTEMGGRQRVFGLNDLTRAQLRRLLNDMLQLFRLGKRHIDAAKNVRFRARRRFALHNQRNLLRRNIADHALKVRSLCVADRNALAGFEPQHSGMRRIFPGQDQESRARHSLRSKKLWHRAFLPFP